MFRSIRRATRARETARGTGTGTGTQQVARGLVWVGNWEWNRGFLFRLRGGEGDPGGRGRERALRGGCGNGSASETVLRACAAHCRGPGVGGWLSSDCLWGGAVLVRRTPAGPDPEQRPCLAMLEF